jgi:putative flippase GtrA
MSIGKEHGVSEGRSGATADPEPSVGDRPSQRQSAKQGAVQFVSFVALGGVAAAVNFGSRLLYSIVLPFEIAIVAAYLTAATLGFLLFRRFVFPGSPRPVREQSIAFLIVSLAGMAQTWGVSVVIVRFVWPAMGLPGHGEAIAHLIGICVPIITSYFGHKRLTFNRGPTDVAP